MAVRGRNVRKRAAAKKPAKRLRKVATRKVASAKARIGKSVSAASQSELVRLKRELRAARDRQAASAEILRAIAAAPGDADRALRQVCDTTEHLFGASAVTIRIAGQGDEWSHIVNVGEGAKRIMAQVPAAQLKISGHNMPGAVYRENRQIHLPDIENVDPEIADWPGLKPARAAGTRTLVGIPLRREGKAIGALIVHRKRVAAFSEDELALLQSFAGQAVIAIENARLFNESQEALRRQTATAEVLAVINSSAGNLAPVFDAILKKAHALCGVEFGSLQIHDGENLRAVATHGFSERFTNLLRQGYRAVESPYGSRLLEGERYVQAKTGDAEFSLMRAAGELEGIHTVLFVPLRKEKRLLGMIAAGRREAKPFSEKEISLLEGFAAQAALALENARLFNETKEALERQTATADILKVIASSPTDLQPVFDAIAERSKRLIGGHSTTVQRFVGDMAELAAFTPVSAEADAWLKASYPRSIAQVPQQEIVRDGRATQIPDIEAEGVPSIPRETGRIRGWRSVLFAPLQTDKGPIGAITVTRTEPGRFADHDVELLKTFADQAVIAIQNVKLFEEVQAKTRDLEEALQQQTATADALKVISRSTFDLDAVMNTLTQSAAELCKAEISALFLREGDVLVARGLAGIDTDAGRVEYLRGNPVRVTSSAFIGKALLTGSVINVADAETETDTGLKRFGAALGFRSILFVPLMREGRGIGVFGLARKRTGEFTQREVELVQTFADQAVIAIANVRLFDEVQAKTRDLEESLVYQTGSANILKVIASSPTDVTPVLKAIVDSAAEICNAVDAVVVLKDGSDLRFRAHHGTIPLVVEKWPITPRWTAGRAFIEQRPVHVHDLLSAEGEEFPEGRELAVQMGHRTILSVPMLRESESIGAIVLRRLEVQPFTDRQIELLKTFADQAVIAIENVRLFDEVQARTRDLTEALRFQTASADVLKVISRSPDALQPVLDVIVKTSRELCNAVSSVVFLLKDGRLEAVAASVPPQENPGYRAVRTGPPIMLDQRGSALGRAAREKRTVHVPNSREDPESGLGGPLDLGPARSLLAVPLIQDGRVIGGVTIGQYQVSPFTPRQIELIETFADQAVIAISNVSLFDEVQQRTRELSQSLDELRTAQDRLVQTEKLASLGQLTAGIAHEIKNPLNFVNNFAALSSELTDELLEMLDPAELKGNARQEVDELTHMLKDNLDKIVQHGKRADSIVKNMLLHSRTGSGDHRPVEINDIVEESLNLAYHGARAEKPGFNITLQRDLDPEAGLVDVYPQEITRVLLNLISNGFYAATKRKAEAGDGFEPTLSASTRTLGDQVEIRVRDNGTGIPPEVKERMFNPFFTTKPAGEGTGLGLSMSHDIVVKQHQGRIEVETEPGQFTEFIIILPRAAAALAS